MTVIYIRKYDTFCQIADETKTIELRKKSSFISQLSHGQPVIFVHKHDAVECIVHHIQYGSFRDIIKTINIHNVNKHIKSDEDATELYSSYYKNFDTAIECVAIFFRKNTPAFLRILSHNVNNWDSV